MNGQLSPAYGLSPIILNLLVASYKSTISCVLLFKQQGDQLTASNYKHYELNKSE
jgi:hypothetical protein